MSRQNAETLKEEANRLYGKGKFSAAKDKYTEAITICPDWAVLYVNRAMCHKKRNEPKQSLEDAERALVLDKDNMKAHYLLGSASGQLGDYDRAITHLQKALEAAREKNDNIKDEIWHQLAEAKYAQWEEQAALRHRARQDLQTLLDRVCDSSTSGGTGHTTPLSDAVSSGGIDTPTLDTHLPGQVPLKPVKSLDSKVSLKAGLQVLLDQAQERDKPQEEVFRDPVITPAGHSYERKALLEHLEKVGKWDPIARDVRVMEAQLTPNLNLRAAVQVFLDQHPYAWGECR